ncbi:hypothetical protein ACTL6P_22655 [Endozoicomonas acroporae]|uniref:hypothetical protein n=1 Tax=Endozoicomonas acroporae TaxID=1701104 RepID=UPI000C77417D|nr:hypothetical protein [Endozoicomonas acroporae]
MNRLAETGSFAGSGHCADQATAIAVNQKGILSRFKVSDAGKDILNAILHFKHNKADIPAVAAVNAYKSLSGREVGLFENVLDNYLPHFLSQQDNTATQHQQDFFVNFSQYQLLLKLENMV